MRLKLSAVIALLIFTYLVFGKIDAREMTLEEKVGQMLMVHFNGREVNESAEQLILEEKIGGIILFNWSNGLTSPEQVRGLTSGLQNVAKATEHSLPLLIAVDQEGGYVARLTEGFTHFPGNRAVAMTGNPSFAYRSAYAMGLEQLDVGINMTLAPVVDTTRRGKGSVIGVRSFGEEASVVVEYAREALSGYRDAGIISTLKHYPGLGNISVDPHFDSSVNESLISELFSTDLLPFTSFAKVADAIMTGHVVTKALDPDNCATFSKTVLRLLREDCGFEGVIMSDSLVMDAVMRICPSIEEAAVRAISAGCDLLLLGGKQLNESSVALEVGCDKIRSIRHAICDAVREGRIDEMQIDRSFSRILQLKGRLNIIEDGVKPEVEENRKLATEIAKQSFRMHLGQVETFDSLSFGKLLTVAPIFAKSTLQSINDVWMKKNETTFYSLGMREEEHNDEGMDQQIANADTVIFFSYNAWKSQVQVDLLNKIHSSGKPVILIALADEEDLKMYSDIPISIATYSPSPASIQNAMNIIFSLDETSL